MSVDVACGELAFVDLTFAGLESLPGPGEERRSRATCCAPRAAVRSRRSVLARLGLSVALVSPIGGDADGDFLRSALAAEGVAWAGRTVARTAVTAVMPVGDERAMATFDPGEQTTAHELAAVDPGAVVISLPRLELVPPGARAVRDGRRRRGAR